MIADAALAFPRPDTEIPAGNKQQMLCHPAVTGNETINMKAR
jgi:hypothetical protein